MRFRVFTVSQAASSATHRWGGGRGGPRESEVLGEEPPLRGDPGQTLKSHSQGRGSF